MKSLFSQISSILLATCAMGLLPAHAQTFDPQDLPQVQQMKQLDWKSVDLEKVDAPSRYAAMTALQDVLAIAKEKAEARREVMAVYFETNNLVDEYLANQPKLADLKLLTFDDARKIAVAYVKSPLSGGRFEAPKTEAGDAEVMGRMATAMQNMSEKRWTEARAARLEVESLAAFLKSKGKFEDYMTWAAAERGKIKAARDAEVARQREESIKSAQEKKEAAAALAEQQRREQRELDAKRLQYAYQLESQRIAAGAAAQQAAAQWNSWLDNDPDIYVPYAYHVWRAGGVPGRSLGDRWASRPRPMPRGR